MQQPAKTASVLPTQKALGLNVAQLGAKAMQLSLIKPFSELFINLWSNVFTDEVHKPRYIGHRSGYGDVYFFCKVGHF